MSHTRFGPPPPDDDFPEVLERTLSALLEHGKTQAQRQGQVFHQTIGRNASTRGLVDAVGEGAKVIVEVSGCVYSETFAGEAVVGSDPLPPFHPNCTCTASAS